MNFSSPEIFDISLKVIGYLVKELNLPVISDISNIQTWATQVAQKSDIEKYIAYYNDDIIFVTQEIESKYILASIILVCLAEKEETYQLYRNEVITNILHADYHIHEGLVHWWAHNTIEEGKEEEFSLVYEMRDLFLSRYLTRINYTYQAPSNPYAYYDYFEISCLEQDAKLCGSLTIHNPQQNTSSTYYFDISWEQWNEIAKRTKNIGIPHTVNRYDSTNMEYIANHILEMYNAKYELFYKDNWNEANSLLPNFKLIIKDLLLEIVNVDIDELAEKFFPKQAPIMSEMQKINCNSAAWDSEFRFLSEVIQTRFDLHLGVASRKRSVYEVSLPKTDIYSSLGILIRKYDWKFEERVILALAMAVHLRPQVLDDFFQRNSKYERTYTEVGGLKGKFHSGFLPTLETACYLLAGVDISKRIQILNYYFGENSNFGRDNILRLETKESTEPAYAGQLVVTQEYLEYLTTGKSFKPDYHHNFPAELLTTKLEWKDLFLEQETIDEIQNIETWLTYQHKIMEELELRKHLKLGYRALFHGTSGTGKTLTATLLGKNLGLDVYRVDLSMISSKWIGETTKNLARLFDMAENKNWILFFDEAESLFGKRSQNVERATDAYYNQEVGYMLQRIENYDGLVILATNLLDNIDTAFMRRFQSLVYFPVPSPSQQMALWRNIFAKGLPLSKNVSLKILSEKYVLTASNITNVLGYATIKTLQNKTKSITMQTLTNAIEKELKKANMRESVGFKK